MVEDNNKSIEFRKRLGVVFGFLLLLTGIVFIILGKVDRIKYYLYGEDKSLLVLPSGEEEIVKEFEKKNGENSKSIDLSEISSSTNMIIIPKMGVKAEILEGGIEQLSRGVWLMPNTSTPDQGGNTVITAHRWKFKPPDPRTFYNIDKMQVGDVISIRWKRKIYYYKVIETKVVTPDQTEILYPTKDPMLTLFSCTPLYQTTHRQVVRASLVKVED